jgi:MraZ protein
MSGFIYESESKVDTKGRFLLPINVRKKLPKTEEANSFVVCRGYDDVYLDLYPIHVWRSRVQDKLDKLSDFNPEARRFKRMFLNGATELELDTAGRALIPKHLLEWAGITVDIMISAQGDKLEIWDTKKYNQFFDQRQEEEKVALGAKLLGDDFGGLQ